MRRSRPAVAAAIVACLVVTGIWTATSSQAALPAGFQDVIINGDLELPVAVRFASDGRVFVAEKSGLIKVFDDLADQTPTIFADLSTQVYSFFDRGLLGLELHPNFPAQPFVYALYTYDGDIGGTAPKWGTAGVLSDPCPTPPGPNTDGCVASARLSRLTASGDHMTSESVLIEDWCQQFPTHSIGTVTFGPDGALYAGGGDAAGYGWVDYGQEGDPVTNPCGDPPGGVGGSMTPPTAEGGSLRSQDLRTPGDAAGLDGTIIRIDPISGAPMPDNPFIGSPDPMAQRVIAYGLRNPYRFTFKPGTQSIYVADVGASTYEEIDIIPDPSDAVVENFGWPCYEGPGRYQPFDSRDFTVCESLYTATPAAVGPFFTYQHNTPLYPGDQCSTGGGVMSAIEFYEGGNYPPQYNGALFFADYTRSCIWVMFPGPDGNPDPSTVQAFNSSSSFPVDLQVGPGGDLFYLDIVRGNLRRIQFFSSNQPPTARINATPANGPIPLTVDFDASGSSDLDPGDTLTYEWDLDGDGQFDDGTNAQQTHVYTEARDYTVRLRATDPGGASNIASVIIGAGNTPPVGTIVEPQSTLTWRVGETINLAGQGTDAEESLAASAFRWDIVLEHCPSTCHEHFLQSLDGQNPTTFIAPDHEYPSHLEVTLTVTDSRGLTDTDTVEIFPETVPVTLQSSPSGLQLGLNTETAFTPFTRSVIIGSRNSLTSPSPQTLSGQPYAFSSWSDGGAQSHDVVAGASAATYQATYVFAPVPIVQEIAIQDTRFLPGAPTIPFGQVRWTNTGANNHTVTSVVSGLFGSGTMPPGSTFVHHFSGAGLYQYRDTISGFTGNINVPMVVSPTSGFAATPFTATWATQAPAAGQTFNVQVRRPGSSQFTNWLTNQTGTNAVFTPDAGAGTYSFRARLVTPSGSTGTSPPVNIQVSANASPTAVIVANPTSGSAPLTVNFDGTGSSDPEGGALSYDWDLNGDGVFGDASSPDTLFSYGTPGTFTVQLRVTDPVGAQDTESVQITAEGPPNDPPTATIDLPSPSLTWRVGDSISFSGSGADESGALPASAMSWSLIQHHCPSTCHTHVAQQFTGVASGSFTAPDHESPSHLELLLTVTDPGGLSDTDSVVLNPQMVTLTFESTPGAASLVVNGVAAAAPFTRDVIIGSSNPISAPSPQVIGGSNYDFSSWSDGGAQSHTVVAGQTAATYLASFQTSAIPVVLNVSIGDTGFTPAGPSIPFGRVRWTNNGVNNHTVKSSSGASGMFDSGVLTPGSTFEHHFFAAGQYQYKDTISGFSAWVNVPVTVDPPSGSVTTQFTVRWASQSPPAGSTFSVQYRRQGAAWVNWLTGETGVSAAWAPDAGAGRYEFRARYFTPTNSSQWSLARVVQVN